MASAQISSPLEWLLSLCAECHPLLSHFKELTDILAHMVQGAVATWRPPEARPQTVPGRYRSLYRTGLSTDPRIVPDITSIRCAARRARTSSFVPQSRARGPSLPQFQGSTARRRNAIPRSGCAEDWSPPNGSALHPAPIALPPALGRRGPSRPPR